MSELDPTLQRLQKLAAIGETSAATWHELRNLITAIVGFSQVGHARGDAGYLVLVQREAARCLELLDNQLELSRVDAANMDIVDVEEVVRHVASSTSYHVALQRVTLHVRTIPLEIRACRGELQHVLLNLVVNALDATPHGGEISIVCERAGDQVEIAVTDTGSGVPPELRASIFTPFFTTKRHKGTGLGLAICKTILDRHGGSIELDGERTHGARFVVRLPVAA
jgi:two-component system, sporulation sensor kinase D